MSTTRIAIIVAACILVLYYITTPQRSVGLFSEFLKQCTSVADIGSGANGVYAKLMRDRGLDVKLFDLYEYDSSAAIQPVIFDGEHVPLLSKSVDACVALYSLHSMGAQNLLLAEMRRIARKYVLVLEDVVEPDSAALIKERRQNRLFHTIKEWSEMFSNAGMRVLQTKILPAYFCPFNAEQWWYPVRKVAFVVSVNE